MISIIASVFLLSSMSVGSSTNGAGSGATHCRLEKGGAGFFFQEAGVDDIAWGVDRNYSLSGVVAGNSRYSIGLNNGNRIKIFSNKGSIYAVVGWKRGTSHGYDFSDPMKMVSDTGVPWLSFDVKKKDREGKMYIYLTDAAATCKHPDNLGNDCHRIRVEYFDKKDGQNSKWHPSLSSDKNVFLISDSECGKLSTMKDVRVRKFESSHGDGDDGPD